MKEETSDTIYLKYHNFFEKKEKEYRNKIMINFRTKKIQNVIKEEKKIYKRNSNDEYNIEKDESENNQNNYHPNIIKIML